MRDDSRDDEPSLRVRRWVVPVAGVSTIIPVLAAVVLMAVWSISVQPGQHLGAERHQTIAAALIVAQLAGFALAVIALCCMQASSSRAAVITLSIVGLVLNVLVGLTACLYFVVAGMKSPWAAGGK